jgi:UDP-4-amino-4,6-dideoxy-N-acetyl-beta-L-altrosamine N-acetyltransferase
MPEVQPRMVRFREIEVEDGKLILDWRTSEKVSQYMSTEVKYDLKKQRDWILDCYSKKDYYHWIVNYKNKDIGYINLSSLDLTQKKTSWGFYIGADNVLGLGSIIPLYFYNYCFYTLSLNSIYGQVFSTNSNLIKMHVYHGYEKDPANDEYIFKNDKKILTKSYILTKENFIKKNFSNYIKDFPVTKWKGLSKS